MRKLVIVLGALLVAGAAHAQQHPWVPSGYNGATGSQANDSAPAVAEQHPWVPSSVYTANQQQPNSAPAYAADRAPAAAKHHHTTETK